MGNERAMRTSALPGSGRCATVASTTLAGSGTSNEKRLEVCCVGDDLPDLPMMERAGLSVAVADAAAEVRNAAVLITKKGGGRGAVREVCEFILTAKGLWPGSGK